MLKKFAVMAVAALAMFGCDAVEDVMTVPPVAAQQANPVFQPYAQVSHPYTVPVNGTIQAPIGTTDEASGISVENDALVVPVDGCYFAMFAPQVGGEAPLSPFEAFMRVNGMDVPNSNVLMWVRPDVKDVIVSQAILCLDAGDAVSFHVAGQGVFLEAINPPNGNPLVPAHITSMFYVSR